MKKLNSLLKPNLTVLDLTRIRTLMLLAILPMLGIVIVSNAQTISAPTGLTLPMTICPGTTLSVGFTTTGSFNGGNVFQVQLSSVSGSFGAGTTIIGSGSTSPISATVAITTTNSTGYRIRVVSSAPIVNGTATASGQITVRTKPSSPSTTAGNRCGTGQVNLGSSGCTSTKWFAASTGGSSLGTSAAFLTPSIAITTNFFAACVDGFGCESIRTSATATVNPLPTVSGFSPATGIIDLAVIDITGTNLSNVDSVKFNTTKATDFTINGATSISATVPVGATTGPITVYTSCGPGASSGNFTPIKPTIANPTISLASGTYENGLFTTLACATTGADIYYTTNGNNPVVGSVFTKLYADEAIFIPSSLTLRAIGYHNGWTTSGVASASYVILNPNIVAKPTISPATGSFTGGQLVTLTCSTPQSVIYFTLNGQIPVPFVNTPIKYIGPFSVVNPQTTVRAVGTREDWSTSDCAAAFYTITGGSTLTACSFSPLPGSFALPQSVTISNSDPSASIYFTKDGTDPYKLLPLAKPYTGPVAINVTATLKAQAFRNGFGDSPRTIGNYTIGSFRQAVDNPSDANNYYTEETSVYGLGPEKAQLAKEISTKSDLITVYPNPSSGAIYIDFGASRENVEISVIDLVGRVVQQAKTNEASFGAAMTLTGNKSGFYIIRLKDTEGNVVDKRVVLQ